MKQLAVHDCHGGMGPANPGTTCRSRQAAFRVQVDSPGCSDETTDPNFLQAIANTAGFHMRTIEQGGNRIYPAMAQRASSVEVLRILISVGSTETMHFQTWADKTGNAPPVTAVDPMTRVWVTFPDLNSPPFGGEFPSL